MTTEISAISAVVDFQAEPTSVVKHLEDHVRHVSDEISAVSVEMQTDCAWVLTQSDGATVLVSLSQPGQADRARAQTFRAIAIGSDATATRQALARFARLPFTRLEMAATRDQMPITAGIARMLPDRPLEGLGVLVTIHHMSDFLVLVESLISLGADPRLITVIDKQYSYAKSERVDAQLVRGFGITVGLYANLTDTVRKHHDRVSAAGWKSVIMDDGGYVTPVIIRDLPETVSHWIGVVEQTASGIWKIEDLAVPYPVFTVAESRLKGTIESYGIADAAVRNVLNLLPNEKFEGQPAVVIGYGRIGRQVGTILRSRRMRVGVFDREITHLLRAHEEGFETRRSLSELLSRTQPLLVVGCAGRKSFGLGDAMSIKRDCYLVSTTSRDYEFDLPALREASGEVENLGLVGTRFSLKRGSSLTILGHGMPINFHFAESLPNKYVDVVLGGLIVGAVMLASADNGFEPGLRNLERTNRALAESGIIDAYYALHGPENVSGTRLTDDRA